MDAGEIKRDLPFNSSASNDMEEVPNELLLQLKSVPEPPSTHQPPRELQSHSSLSQMDKTSIEDLPHLLSSSDPECDYEKIFPYGKTPVKESSTESTELSLERRFSHLQELIAIYDKISKGNSNSFIRSNNLDNFFSAIASSLKQEAYYKRGNLQKKTKANYNSLVTTFQQLAQSSLSITQIASLNNIIAGLQDYLNKDYHSLISDLAEMTKIDDAKCQEDKPKENSCETKSNSKPVEEVKKKPPGGNGKMKKTKKPQTLRKCSEKPKNFSKRVKNIKSLQEGKSSISLPLPTNLEDVLKLGFGSSARRNLKTLNKKLLVTVELSGSQVLVNNVSYVQNLNSENLMKKQKKEPGTSELIIENISKNHIWYKSTKSSNLRILNRYLTEEKPQFQVRKPPKKGNSPKGKKLTKGRNLTGEKTPSKRQRKQIVTPERRFEYDQDRLRAEYPINSIAEVSETKFDQKDSRTKKICTKPQRNLGKGVAEKGNLSKSVIYGRGEGKLGLVKSCTFRRHSKVKTTQKKKKPSVLKESLKTFNQSRAAKSVIIPMKPSLNKFHKSLAKKEVEEKKPKMTSPELPKLIFPVKPETRQEPTENTTLYLSSDLIPESSSIEFLFTEIDTDAPSRVDSHQLINGRSESEIRKKSHLTCNDFVQKESLMTDKKSEFLERSLDSPIALLPPSSRSEMTNFPMELIHSDSFLVNFPPLRVSRSKLNALFKVNSELKFYPGRLTESKNEEAPFVTFVLTPKQKEEADLPANQVKVVSRPMKKKTEDEIKVEDEETEEEEQSDIEKIDEFIDELSKWNKLVQKKRTQAKPSTKLENHFWQGGSRPLSCRKIYHECEKRKLADMNKKKPENEETKNKIEKTKETPRGSFPKGKPEIVVGDGLGKGSQQKSQENVKYKLKGLSVKLSDVTPELLEAVKTTINQAVGLTRKEEILAAIEEGFTKNQQEIGTIGKAELVSNNFKKFKIKIQGKSKFLTPSTERKTLRICQSFSATKKTEQSKPEKTNVGEYLVYFDAQETIEQDEDKDQQPKGTTKENNQLNFDPIFISSISDIFPNDFHTVMMSKSNDCEKLKKLLSLVEDKTRDLMMKIESNVWVEVLVLLEELSQAFDVRDVENFKTFLLKIRTLNNSRIKNFNKSFSIFENPWNSVNDEQTKKTFFEGLKKNLNFLKQKITIFRRSTTPADYKQGVEFNTPSAVSLPDFNEKTIPQDQNEEIQARNLKRKLQQHLSVLQELVKEDKGGDPPATKLHDLQKKVADKLQSLENTPKEPMPSMALKSLLEFHSGKLESSSDDENLNKFNLTERLNFLELMSCFISTWNSKTPIDCIKSDYCHG